MQKTLKAGNQLKLTVSILFLAAFLYFIFFTHSGVRLTHGNVHQWSDYIRSFGVYAIIFGVLAVFVQTLFPIVPFMLVAGTNVLLFGFVWGFTINYVVSTIAAVVTLLYTRYFSHQWAMQRISKFPTALLLSEKVKENGFTYMLIARFIAFIPSLVVNLVGGVTRVSFLSFLAATLIGNLPIVLMESTIGHDLIHFKEYKGRLFLLLFIFIILVLVGNLFKKRVLRKRV